MSPTGPGPTDAYLDRSRPTICLYHDDPDGCCAAAIVRRALGGKLFLFPLEIGDPIPWDSIEKNEQVVLVDYSLPPEEMQRLKSDRKLVWVDHHKTSLARLGEAMADVPGERSLDAAACVLTWRTFFPEDPIPQAVSLIGDRDIWQMAYPETRAFSEGLFQEQIEPTNDRLWEPLLDDDEARVRQLIERGRVLYDARLKSIKDVVFRYGFVTSFEGHTTMVVNHRGNGDMGEYIRKAGYELAYCYVEVVRNGLLQTTVTLYSDQIDVSEIARKFGGGGHRGAAGFQFTRTDRPFPPGSMGTSPRAAD
jgi:oligoribonuclease NrnB/cAMP/cGMP phosphodiesterase (DHH superfamily)